MKKLNDAQRELVENNTKLVTYVIKKYFSWTLNKDIFDDVYQEGCLGLCRSAAMYDETKAEFSTYAVPMIIGYIKRYLLEKQNLIKVPRSLFNVKYKEYKELRDNEDSDSIDDPELKEMSSKMNLLSLDSVLYGKEDDVNLYDAIEDDRNDYDYLVTYDSIEQIAMKFIDSLKTDDRHKKIYEDIFYNIVYQLETQLEIANRLGISQPHASRIERAIRTHIRLNFTK